MSVSWFSMLSEVITLLCCEKDAVVLSWRVRDKTTTKWRCVMLINGRVAFTM